MIKILNGLVMASICLSVSAGQVCPSSTFTPDYRYEINANGSEVYDSQTQLTWKRCSEGTTWGGGKCIGTRTTFPLNGKDRKYPEIGAGWRLPNIDELKSILSGESIRNGGFSQIKGCWSPAINQTIFPDVVDNDSISNKYLSSSLWYGDKASMFYASFYSADIDMTSFHENRFYIRLVKGDQFVGDLISSGRALNPLARYKSDFEQAKNAQALSKFISKYESGDPEGLVPKAKLELKRITLEEYRNAFAVAVTSYDFEGFIKTYTSKDPDNLIPKARQKMQQLQKSEKGLIAERCQPGNSIFIREKISTNTSSGNALADLLGWTNKEEFLIQFEGVVKSMLGKKVEVYIQDFDLVQNIGGGIFQPVTGRKQDVARYAKEKVGRSQYFDQSICLQREK